MPPIMVSDFAFGLLVGQRAVASGDSPAYNPLQR